MFSSRRFISAYYRICVNANINILLSMLAFKRVSTAWNLVSYYTGHLALLILYYIIFMMYSICMPEHG